MLDSLYKEEKVITSFCGAKGQQQADGKGGHTLKTSGPEVRILPANCGGAQEPYI